MGLVKNNPYKLGRGKSAMELRALGLGGTRSERCRKGGRISH